MIDGMGIMHSAGEITELGPFEVGQARVAAARQEYARFERDWDAEFAAVGARLEGRACNLTRVVEAVLEWDRPIEQALMSSVTNCVSECRSALDNTIVAMVREAGGSDAEINRASFPLVASEETWAAAASSRLPVVGDDVRARVRSLQAWAPEQRVKGPGRHPLEMLKMFDRHRHQVPLQPALLTMFPKRTNEVGQLEVTLTPWEAEKWMKSLANDDAITDSQDVRYGVVRHGDVVLRTYLPEGTKTFTYTFPRGVFSVGVIVDGLAVPEPLLHQLKNLMRFTDEAVHYLVGKAEKAPAAWVFGDVTGVRRHPGVAFGL